MYFGNDVVSKTKNYSGLGFLLTPTIRKLRVGNLMENNVLDTEGKMTEINISVFEYLV